MTLQEQFDKVVTHLLIQNARSINETGSCAYRGLDGQMCAAGCMIPDEIYVPEMENKSWRAVADTFNVGHFLDHDLGRALQVVHDNTPVELWPEVLTNVAKNYKLSIPKILEDAVVCGTM